MACNSIDVIILLSFAKYYCMLCIDQVVSKLLVKINNKQELVESETQSHPHDPGGKNKEQFLDTGTKRTYRKLNVKLFP